MILYRVHAEPVSSELYKCQEHVLRTIIAIPNSATCMSPLTHTDTFTTAVWTHDEEELGMREVAHCSETVVPKLQLFL
jgi:hypothetical protein